MTPDHGLDRLLDRAIVPGYGRLGWAIRRRHWADDDPAPGSLAGCRAVVTGAGRGLGEATALGLARLGATVHLVARSADRALPAIERIAAALATEGREANLHAEACDVADFTSVRHFVDAFRERLDAAGQALDILVHNAGVLPEARTLSVDGHELTLATHVLGPALLTEGLRPVLAHSARGARTIFVSSGGQYTQKLPLDDPEFERGQYRGSVAYARTKRMQVEFVALVADRCARDTALYAMHPGWADTPGVASSLPGFHTVTRPLLRSPEAGADTVVWLASRDVEPPPGTFWHDRSPRPINYGSRTSSSSEQVGEAWDWVLAQIGLRPGTT